MSAAASEYTAVHEQLTLVVGSGGVAANTVVEVVVSDLAGIEAPAGGLARFMWRHIYMWRVNSRRAVHVGWRGQGPGSPLVRHVPCGDHPCSAAPAPSQLADQARRPSSPLPCLRPAAFFARLPARQAFAWLCTQQLATP